MIVDRAEQHLPQTEAFWMSQAFIPKLAFVGSAFAPEELHAERRRGCAGSLLRWFVRDDDMERAP